MLPVHCSTGVQYPCFTTRYYYFVSLSTVCLHKAPCKEVSCCDQRTTSTAAWPPTYWGLLALRSPLRKVCCPATTPGTPRSSLAASRPGSDSYMCRLHRTGAHWIPRMKGLYPPQAKVETGNVVLQVALLGWLGCYADGFCRVRL